MLTRVFETLVKNQKDKFYIENNISTHLSNFYYINYKKLLYLFHELIFYKHLITFSLI